jgi:outer membrane protein assembly factor BamB
MNFNTLQPHQTLIIATENLLNHKKKILFIIAILVTFYAQAQKRFEKLYSSKWPVTVDWREYNEDLSLALGGDLREISMMDARNGKILWSMNFKEKFNMKKATTWGWENEKGLVYVDFKTNDKTTDTRYYFDELTGIKIDDYNSIVNKIKVTKINPWKSYTSLKSAYDDEAENIHLKLAYKRKIFGSAVGEGTRTDITLESTGKYFWSTTFQGGLIRSLCDNAMGSMTSQSFGGDYLNMVVGQGKVFVVYEGISCFDIETGEKLWQSTFDNAKYNFGLFKQRQTLGRAAMPLILNNGVIVVDLSSGARKIKKLDLNTGKVIWETIQFNKNDLVPEIVVVDNVLIARFGGRIETQTYIPPVENRPAVCKKEFKLTGPFYIKAFDLNTGTLLWQSYKMKALGDKLSSGTSNILTNNHKIFFASQKNIFCMEANSGNIIYKTKISKIGNPREIWFRKNDVIIEGQSGIASVNAENGQFNYGLKTKRNLGSFGTPDAFYIWTGKSEFSLRDFIRVDLDNAKILGIQKKTSNPCFNPEYEEFLKFDGNKVSRFKTRP